MMGSTMSNLSVGGALTVLTAVLTGVVEIGALLKVHTLYLFLYLTKKNSAVGCLTSCMVRFDVLSALFENLLYLVVCCYFCHCIVFLSCRDCAKYFWGNLWLVDQIHV